ncbi:metal-sensing transcriptional repressor, partial [Bacillus pumilus]
MGWGRGEKEKEELMNGLKGVEGEVGGIEEMIEKDGYCIDVVNEMWG